MIHLRQATSGNLIALNWRRCIYSLVILMCTCLATFSVLDLWSSTKKHLLLAPQLPTTYDAIEGTNATDSVGGHSSVTGMEQEGMARNDVWWLDMRDNLCPNMVPKNSLARKIFQLARNELLASSNLVNSSIDLSRLEADSCGKFRDHFSKRFFTWSSSWGGISRQSDGNIPGLLSVAKMWKCANNQVDGFWSQVFDHGETERWDTFSTSQRKGFDQRLRQYQDTGIHECIVAVIRDPVSHFLSGYNEIEYRIHFGPKEREEIASAWPFGAFSVGSRERFQQFLVDLLSCPFERKYPGMSSGTKYYPGLELQHVFSMSGVLEQLALETMAFNVSRKFSYLPTLDNFTNNWGPFIVKSCPGSLSEATKQRILSTPMNTTQGEHTSSQDPIGSYAVSNVAWSEGGPFARALCALHIMDYACWNDLPEGIPTVCFDLYRLYHRESLVV